MIIDKNYTLNADDDDESLFEIFVSISGINDELQRFFCFDNFHFLSMKMQAKHFQLN